MARVAARNLTLRWSALALALVATAALASSTLLSGTVLFDAGEARPKPRAPAAAHLSATPASFVTRPASADSTLTPAQAVLRNLSVPFSRAPVIAAQPFSLAQASAQDKARALDCLTAAIYYEAGFEPTEGQRAVAQVVLNRVRHPAFPKTVCGVVYQGAPSPGCQFTFACDGSTARAPAAWAWRRAKAVAAEALSGTVMAEVGEATHYHADYVAPNWPLAKITQIGAHIFYNLNGASGLPMSFKAAYAGGEPTVDLRGAPPPSIPDPAALALAASPATAEEPHAPNDVGGRVDLSHGWTPAPPPPPSDAMSRVLAAQKASSTS